MDKLRVGILGTGSMAGTMARSMASMKNIEAAAVASRTKEKAEKFAEEFGIPKAYGTYEELYRDPSIDIIYIVSPHSHHALYAKECIEVGKPSIVEKSFTVNAREAREVLAFAEEKKVFITEAIWTRYMPMVGMIRDAVQSGIIGKVTAVHADLGYGVSTRERVIEPSLAGGALLDVGIYALTFIALILGEDVKDIAAMAHLSEKGVDLENEVMLRYGEGEDSVLASFTSSITGPTDRDGIIYGTEGYMVVGNVNNYGYIEVYDNAHRLLKRIDAPAQEETGYVYQFEACRKALSEGALECPEMPHALTIRVMEIMDEIRAKMGVSYPME